MDEQSLFIGPMLLVTLEEIHTVKEADDMRRQRRNEAEALFPSDEEIKQRVQQHYGAVLSEEELKIAVYLQIQRKTDLIRNYRLFGEPITDLHPPSEPA